MHPLFTVRWPLFVRLEALLIFIAILSIYSKIPGLRSVVDEFSSAAATRLGISRTAMTWAAIAVLTAFPYLGVMIATDRILSARFGFAWLSVAAVAIWASLAATFSGEIAALLPPPWTRGSAIMSFTGEAAVAAASIAVLIHARPLWVGLADEGFAGLNLPRSGSNIGWRQPNPWLPADPRIRASRATIGRPPFRLALTLTLGVLVALMRISALLHTGGNPGLAHVVTPGEAEAWRGRNGSFYFQAEINGQPTPMLLDTGASRVGIRAEDAARFGIETYALSYSAPVNTANGVAFLAPVTLDTVTVGSITMRSVPALVAKPGVLHNNLLGQTFLARLREFKVEGDRVVLHGD
jgi:aspartyl protease family protein